MQAEFYSGGKLGFAGSTCKTMCVLSSEREAKMVSLIPDVWRGSGIQHITKQLSKLHYVQFR